MTGSWTQSFCSSVRIQIHGLSGYLLLQFRSYSFNILYDVYTHNGGVHVHRILMVRRGHHLCLTDTLHFLKITPDKTTLSIIIKCGGILLFQFLTHLYILTVTFIFSKQIKLIIEQLFIIFVAMPAVSSMSYIRTEEIVESCLSGTHEQKGLSKSFPSF